MHPWAIQSRKPSCEEPAVAVVVEVEVPQVEEEAGALDEGDFAPTLLVSARVVGELSSLVASRVTCDLHLMNPGLDLVSGLVVSL